ncbi:MAG: DegV family protein [Candidatus Heimdallarchaeota archaeon]
MNKVAIVTDGVCDISQAMIDEYDITSAPFRIFFGDEVYRTWYNEKSTISLEEFCSKLATTTKDNFPKTSIPSPGEIALAYEEALKKADSIIGIFLSAAMSGIVQAAQNAAKTIFPDKDITIFDSKHTMSGTGIQALEAAKMAKAGKSKEEILARLKSLNPRVRTIFVMNDLNYLYKGGRIGRAKKLLGSAFNVIPTVHMQDGIINPLKAFKGNNALSENLNAFCAKVMDHCETNDVIITHINHHEITQKMYKTMKETNSNGVNIHYSEASPIMGVYTGPKSICISYIGNFDKSWLMK